MSIAHVTASTFQAEVLGAELPVVVDLWAPWCPPCRAAAPVLGELAEAFGGRVKVASIDVEAERALGSAMRVRAVPTFAVVHRGQVVRTVAGYGGRTALQQLFAFAAALRAPEVSASPR